MEKPVARLSSKSTKEEMMKAYNELLTKFQERVANLSEKKAEIKRSTDTAVVEKASTYTVETIIKGLADLNLNVGKGLTELARELTAEAGKLTDIREAIAVETRALEELHDIRLAADTLASLIQEHEQRKAAFEEEMTETEEEFNNEMTAKRTDWKKEQEAYNAALKDNEARLKKEREREREEYEYNLALTRKKDRDLYEEQKAIMEKALREEKLKQERELSVREATVAAQEADLAELRARVAAFPAELTAAVEQAQREAALQAESRAKQEAQLWAKEVEGDKRVAQLRITALEETVKKQLEQIESLTKKLNDANTQVQEIAIRAIEGASNARALSSINEIAMEQAKNIRAKS
jgi:hypothetical protein